MELLAIGSGSEVSDVEDPEMDKLSNNEDPDDNPGELEASEVEDPETELRPDDDDQSKLSGSEVNEARREYSQP